MLISDLNIFGSASLVIVCFIIANVTYLAAIFCPYAFIVPWKAKAGANQKEGVADAASLFFSRTVPAFPAILLYRRAQLSTVWPCPRQKQRKTSPTVHEGPFLPGK
ncbi:MAG: hypothetical protein GX881_08325 [Firmicutes bacterium]|nr:hypothetical protein [Bacillota bacterium]